MDSKIKNAITHYTLDFFEAEFYKFFILGIRISIFESPKIKKQHLTDIFLALSIEQVIWLIFVAIWINDLLYYIFDWIL
jgi:hypothetical protein